MDSRASKLARIDYLDKQILKGYKYYTLLEHAAREKTPKAEALIGVIRELKQEKASLELELIDGEIDNFLSSVGGIRVSD